MQEAFAVCDLTVSSLESTDEKLDIFTGTIEQAYQNYHVELLNFVRAQIESFLNENQKNATDPIRLNYLLGQILRIRRRHLQHEFERKLNGLVHLSSKHLDCIDFAKDLRIQKFEKKILELVSLIDNQFNEIYAVLEQGHQEIFQTKISKLDTGSEKLTDFHSDTEYDAHKTQKHREIERKSSRNISYSDDDIEKLNKLCRASWNREDDDSFSECSDNSLDESLVTQNIFYDTTNGNICNDAPILGKSTVLQLPTRIHLGRSP
jgi:hypothetical protein